MALSYTEITLDNANGATDKDNTEFSFTFDFINTGDIKAIVSNNSGTTWTSVLTNSGATGDFDSNGIDATNKKIKLAAAPSASPTNAVVGSLLRIYRATTLNAIVDFQGGSRIAEADLDNAYKQGLFCAQEVSENASTLGGSGAALGDNSVDHNHIVTDAVRADEIQANAVGTSELAANSVTTAITADTMNWNSEGSTIILPTANRNLAADDANYGWNGVLAVDHGGTGYSTLKTSSVLEKITGVCDGTAVTRAPDGGLGGASLTLPNVTAVQNVSTSWADVSGSAITLAPHSEATRVEYEFSFTVSKDATAQALTYFKLMATDEGSSSATEVEHAQFTLGGTEFNGTLVHFKWVFGRYDANVGSGYTDLGMGVFGSTASLGADPWNGTRTLYLQVKQEADALPTLSRRKSAISAAQLTDSGDVLAITTSTNWIDLDPGRTEIVKVAGPWSGATTSPVGYYKATYVSNTQFTATPLAGADETYSGSEMANGYVYSWVHSDQSSDVRLHTVPHHTDEATIASTVRNPVITVTSVK
tara:strand:+ start:1423 stop:3024 length:1602 start_codon:yes stop_codon:yes gene_type:complete